MVLVSSQMLVSSLEDNYNGDDDFMSYLLRAYSYCIFELPPPTPPPRRPFWYHPAYVQNLRRYCFQLQLRSKSICFIRSLRAAGSVHVSVHVTVSALWFCLSVSEWISFSHNEPWNLIIFSEALWEELAAIMLLVYLKKTTQTLLKAGDTA